jgi:subtilisin-like proprotein convertase family protein
VRRQARLSCAERKASLTTATEREVRKIVFGAAFCASILFCSILPQTISAQTTQRTIPSTPVSPSAATVVNFSELARQQARTAAVWGEPQPLIIPNMLHLEAPAIPFTPSQSVLPSEVIQPSAPSPSPGASFAGLDDIPKVGTGFIVIPPDTDGAVGLTKVMSGLNNNYRIQDKATGAVLSTVSIDTFWSASGGSAFFDPKMLFDPINQRWIVVALSDGSSANSSVVIGVSQTSDPSGSYFIFRVDADASNLNWADFPCVGFNKNWVAVNVNMFSISGGLYQNSKMLVVDYAQLRTGTFSGSFLTGTFFCSSPAATYSSTENTLYVVTHGSSVGGTYSLDTVTGSVASPVYTVGTTKSRGLTWAQPGGQILPQAAPLSGTWTNSCGATPCPLETQDSQVRGTPVVRDGFVYYAQTVGLPSGGLTHTAVQWTKLDASTGNVVDGGRVEDATATSSNGGKWYAYPHIAVNQLGDIILGFSQFSSSQYPSAGYTYHDHTDGAGTMRDPLIFKAGEDYYHKTFSGTRNRWGDYSKAQVDPSNDTDLWVLQEYAKARVGTDDGTTGSNSSRWGTWWSSISMAPNIVLTGSALVAENCSPTNGVIDPNETVTVNLALQNIGSANASNVVATLLATGGITSPSVPQSYGTLVAGGVAVTNPFTFTASGACGSNITATVQIQTNATIFGTNTFTFTLGVVSATTNTFANPSSISIPTSGSVGTASPYPSTITVSSVASVPSKVTVTLANINHTWPDDISILLVGPGGQNVMLMSDAGGNAGVTPMSNVTVTFDDTAATQLPQSTQITSGTYRPGDYDPSETMDSPAPVGPYGTALSVFNGVNPNGTWSLYVDDDFAPGDGGSIASGWSLSFITGTNSCCTGSASSFNITSITKTGNNIAITWTTGGIGKTNALQATAGTGNGSYSTNNFANIFSVTNTVGTSTNYLDVGAATNFPSRFYRVRQLQ